MVCLGHSHVIFSVLIIFTGFPMSISDIISQPIMYFGQKFFSIPIDQP